MDIEVCSIGVSKVPGGYRPTVDFLDDKIGAVIFPNVFPTEEEAIEFAKTAVGKMLREKLHVQHEISFKKA